MKESITIPCTRSPLLLNDAVVYAQKSSWFGNVSRPLFLSLIRHQNNSTGPLPAIVWICGGAWLSMNRQAHLPSLVELARQGFAVASVEYRLSNETKYPGPLEDIQDAIRYLREHADSFGIDGSRIGVMGESAGGHLAALAGVNPSGDPSVRVQAACPWYAPFELDFSRYPETQAPADFMAPEKILLGESITVSKERYAEGSAATYLPPIGSDCSHIPPFFILHGTGDTVVSPRQSEDFHAHLEERGISSSLLLLEGAGHAGPEFFQKEVWDRIGDFFKETLGSP